MTLGKRMKLLDLLGTNSHVAQPALMDLFAGECEEFDDGQDRYVSFKNAGVSVMFRDEQLESLFFYAEGIDGFSGYAGQLPFGITFRDSEKQIVERIERAPSSEGNVRGLPFPQRKESNWIRFTLPTWTLHAEFKDPSRSAARLITVMRRDPTHARDN